MRPGQNKRMRGRNNRKGPNPLTRTYESNGPDVKIRGTAHHVAEKYLQLARDAQSSGDPVMAESYLQHAEHYFRLIASAQQAQQQAQTGYARQGEGSDEDMDDDDDMGGLPDRFASPSERFGQPQQMPPQQQPYGQPQPMAAAPQGQPQPFIERPAYNGERQNQPYQGGERQPRQDRPYQDRQDRNGNGNGQNRFNGNRGRDNRPPREFRNDQQPQVPREQPVIREPRPETVELEPNGLPAFITSPVRIATGDQEGVAPMINETEQAIEGGEGGGYHLRPRRRRRHRPEDETSEAPVQGDLPIAE